MKKPRSEKARLGTLKMIETKKHRKDERALDALRRWLEDYRYRAARGIALPRPLWKP